MFTKDGEITSIDGKIQFIEEGRAFISDNSWSENSVEIEFSTIKEAIGICPKYINEQNYLFIKITNERIIISARVKGIERIYKNIDDFKLLEENGLKFETVSDTKHIITLNEKELFQLDSSLFASGQIFICGCKDEVINRCVVEQSQSVAWINNANDQGVIVMTTVEKDEKMFKLVSTRDMPAFVSQNIIVDSEHIYVSFNCKGSGSLLVNDKQQMMLSNTEMKRKSCLVDVEPGGVTIAFGTDSEFYVGDIQVEEGTNETSYIPNESLTEAAVRECTMLSYANKDGFNKDEGSLYVKITPKDSFKKHRVFHTDSNEFSLEFSEPMFTWKAMGNDISVNYLNDGRPIELFVTWSDHEISLMVNGVKHTGQVASASTKKVERLIFADDKYNIDPVILEEWALFKREIDFISINNHIDEASMHSLFEGGITGKNTSWTEIPLAPHDHSPIIVEKEDGEPLQKVSFFDHETGEYKTYNEEPFVYDGVSDFVELAFSNINEQFSRVGILTEEGKRIGEPYQIKGKKLYFSLAGYEKVTYKNKTLTAVYQVKDSYTIDYNIEAVDGYRIDFAAHDGKDRFIFQEGNQYGEQVKLATMVEMNPVQNQQQSGFLYVSKTINSTEDFRITATPDRLLADGFSKSTIVVEALDYQGNFVSHADLQVEAEKGFIARYINKGAAEAQKRSGQYLYQYVAPFIHSNDSAYNIEDHIRIIDKDNNIGVVYKILLRPTSQAHQLQFSKSEKTLWRHKDSLMNHIILYEGLEEREDSELFSILDLDKDSKITLKEIDILETGERDIELSTLIGRLEKWKGAENGENA